MMHGDSLLAEKKRGQNGAKRDGAKVNGRNHYLVASPSIFTCIRQ